MRFRPLLFLLLLAAAPCLRAQDFVFTPQWTAQAQFAGYYVAQKMGFYEEEGIHVRIEHPSATRSALDRVRENQSDATTLQLAQALEILDHGIPLVNILQTSMSNGMVIVSRRGRDPLTLRGARVGTWASGFGQIAIAMSRRENLGYEWIPIGIIVNLFIAGAIDATLAMSYNEYYQILQAGIDVPPEAVYRFSDHGYNVQEDGVYMTRAAYLKDPDRAVRFARASRRGWEWAREHPEETLDIVMEMVRESHVGTNRVIQQLMLDEILRLQCDRESGEPEFRLRPDMLSLACALMLENGMISREITYDELTGR